MDEPLDRLSLEETLTIRVLDSFKGHLKEAGVVMSVCDQVIGANYLVQVEEGGSPARIPMALQAGRP